MPLLILLAVLSAAPRGQHRVSAVQMRLEITPPAAKDDTDRYLVERQFGSAGWELVATLKLSPADSHFDKRSGHLVFTDVSPDAAAVYRVLAVDQIGNATVIFEGARRKVCEWAIGAVAVPISCEAACSCEEVKARLELARSELMRWWLPAFAAKAGALDDMDGLRNFDAALGSWRVVVAKAASFKDPNGSNAVVFGYVDPKLQRVVLSRDMRAGLHELVHVFLLSFGRDSADPFKHPSWDADPALKEIDERYQQRFRDHTP